MRVVPLLSEVPSNLREVHVAHLSLTDFRSYAAVELAAGAGGHRARRPERAGQDQPGRGHGLRRDARQPPGGHRRAARASRAPPAPSSARWWSATTARPLVELEINPGRANRAQAQPLAGPAAARRPRPAAHRAVRPRGPRAGQGRPRRPAAVPRRPARRARPAVRRRARRLRPGAQAAQRPAAQRDTVEARAARRSAPGGRGRVLGRRRGRRARHPGGLGRPSGQARRRAARGAAAVWCGRSARSWPGRTPRSRPRRRRPRWNTATRCPQWRTTTQAAWGSRRAPHSPTIPRWATPARRSRRHCGQACLRSGSPSWSAGSPWSVRTATICS